MIDFKNTFKIEEKYPHYNEPSGLFNLFITRPRDYNDIIIWIERTPEAMAIVNAMVSDVLGDEISFEGAESRVKDAERFMRENMWREELRKFVTDLVILSDAVMWKNTPNSKDLSGLNQALNSPGQVAEVKRIIDEDWDFRECRCVPMSTVDILIDDKGRRIKGYRQHLTGVVNTITWSPEEIIHGQLVPFNGKLYAHSIAGSVLSEMQTIAYIKDYAGKFFKEGGVPDWMFILPKEQANSPNSKLLKSTLEKYKSATQKRGNLVFTGEVNATPIGAMNAKDMEYRQLAVYMTGVLALAWNMPMSRVASIIGVDVKVSAGADDLANEGYWAGISEKQAYLENLFNNQFWIPKFKVQMRIKRGFTIKEVRESQRMTMVMDSITKANSELRRYDKQMSLSKIKSLLRFRDDDFEKSNPDYDPVKTGLARQNQLPLRDLNGGAKQKESAQKAKEVNPKSEVSS